tara:strand:- start:2867 stop:3616 length:750 start_codon:yes stop_codon:yes gene_type:complete
MKMKLKRNIKKNSIFFILFFLIILLCHKIDFFKNFAKVIFFNYDYRISKAYGYCSDTGIGYLRFLKNNFNFKSNPKIIVQSHTPSVNWAIYDLKKIYNNTEELIVLNYPGNIFSKTLGKTSENQFYLDDRIYSSKRIVGLEILGNFDSFINEKFTFKIHTKVKTLEGKKIVKKSTAKLTLNIDNTNKVYFPTDISLLENYYIKNIYLDFTTSKKVKKNISGIKLFFENAVDINKYKIIHSYNNCYYLER